MPRDYQAFPASVMHHELAHAFESTIGDPVFGAAIDLNFAEEKKALEEKAKSAVQQKVEEKLDLKVEEGQTLEDAVKKKAEEELLKGLQNLLK